MSNYLIRLDDASIYMNNNNWNKMFELLDKYFIKPIVAIIPHNEDENLITKYEANLNFWSDARNYVLKGYTIGLHGYNHKFITNSGGINPVNYYSEFAGVSLEVQKEKLNKAMKIFTKEKITPKVFVAPAHTFDLNTLIALKEETNIEVINDMIASSPFMYKGFKFVPQQMGYARKSPLPMKLITYCYHPNTMTDDDFIKLEEFLKKYQDKFIKFEDIKKYKKRRNLYDKLLNFLYFFRRK